MLCTGNETRVGDDGGNFVTRMMVGLGEVEAERVLERIKVEGLTEAMAEAEGVVVGGGEGGELKEKG
jgi:hypothetical protein